MPLNIADARFLLESISSKKLFVLSLPSPGFTTSSRLRPALNSDADKAFVDVEDEDEDAEPGLLSCLILPDLLRVSIFSTR